MVKDKIIILGATGFIGVHLCRKLVKNNFKVVALVRSRYAKNIKQLRELGTDIIHVGDLYEIKNIKSKVSETDYVINLAALAHVSFSNFNLKKNKFNNIEKNIVKNFSNKKLKIIHISTAKLAIVSKNKKYSPYTIIKNNAERIIRNYYENHIILRPPLIYGPNVKANFLSLLKVVHKNYPLPFKYLENKRSYMYVENLTDAICYIIKKNFFKGKTYNISDNCIISTNKLVSLIARFLNTQARHFYIPKTILKFLFIFAGKSDIFNKIFGDFIISNENFITDTKWKPPYDYLYGIKKTCLWYKRKFKV